MSSAMRLGRWIGITAPSLCGRSLLLHLLLFDNNHITNRNPIVFFLPNNSGSTTTTTIAKARAFSTSTTTTTFRSRNRIESSRMNSATESLGDTNASSSFPGTGYLDAVNAAALDEELMATPGFSLEQLMELAGLAVAEVVYNELESAAAAVANKAPKKKKILWICGPGNNGGDGLVAARHVVLFGNGNIDCTIVYPKRSKKQHFFNLVKQCEDVGIEFVDELPNNRDELIFGYQLIVDAIFGFSFSGTSVREPFGTILNELNEVLEARNEVDMKLPKLISVDVPSGWNVNEGDVAETGFHPDVLISLTAPKLCSKEFQGRHFIGGRFLPPSIAAKYNIRMPPYPGVAQAMEVTKQHIEGGSSSSSNTNSNSKSKNNADRPSPEEENTDDFSWREEYEAYLAEKQAEEQETMLGSQNDGNDDSAGEITKEAGDTDATTTTPSVKYDDDDDTTWQEQYAAYCSEKEAKLAEQDAVKRQRLAEEHLAEKEIESMDCKEEYDDYMAEVEKINDTKP